MAQAIKILPARPHLGYLKKLAKEHLALMRARQPATKLAAAQLAVAREHGFASWRALKAHVDLSRRQMPVVVESASRLPAAGAIEEFCKATLHEWRIGTLRRARELLAIEPGLARANIYTACIVGNERRIKDLLKENPSLATAAGGPRGWAPLLYLCYSRFVRLRPRSADRFARCGQHLLDHGADPNSFWMNNDWRETALYGASGLANCAALTKVLLEAGADPNMPDGETLYHTAEFLDHSCLTLVLAKTTRGEWLNYCMGHKLDMEDPVGLQLFLDHGANPNQLGREKTAIQGRRPLHFAIMRHRSARHIRILVKAGADPNLADAQGETPLAMARRLGHAEAARALKAAGALNESTPRADLMAAIMSGNARAARRLIPNPVEFTGTLTEEERALLPFAAEAGNIKAVRVMLDLGWDIETEGSWKGTALHQAIYHGHLELVKFLLARGASVTHKNGFGGGAMGIAMHTALHEGRENFAPIVRLIASRAPRDRLPQHIEAARNEGNLKIVKLLETIAARESER